MRTGTAISAAAVGVGARRSAAKSISVVSVSWPTAEISGMRHWRRGADHDLLVERPQVLEAAAAARDDQHVRARHGSASGRQGVEAPDRGGDLRRPRPRPAPAPARPARGAGSGRRAGAGCPGSPRRSARSPRRSRSGRNGSGCLRSASNSPSAASVSSAVLQQLEQRALAGEFHASTTIWYCERPG